MIRFRSKLFITFISLIIIVMLCLGILLGQFFKTYYFNSFNNRIQHELSIIVNYIEDIGGISAFLNDRKAKNIFSTFESSLTIISMEKEVLYNSYTIGKTSPTLNNDTLRKIVSSRKEGYEVIKDGDELHFYWMPIKNNDEIIGYAVISNEIEEIKTANQQMWWILFISLGTSLMIIIMVGSRIAARYTRPIEAATNAAIELAKGNFRVRTYEEHSDDTSMLSASINILARNLQEMEIAREMQQDRLATLIENIGSGVLLIDSKGYITLINKAYKQLFKVNPSDFLFRLYYEVIEHKEVINLIEEIFMTEKSVKKQMLLPLRLERKHFEVYGAPIIGTNDEWKGIVLVFHDITELKKLEQMRKDFVANVSHELKTPITSIKGFSETLLDGAMKDENTLEYFLTIILKESDRLQTLIQDLLDLSKMEQQEFSLNINRLNISNLLQETYAILEKKAKDKDISFQLETPKAPALVEADSYRLKQVFINLINNAITYTPNGGEIKVIVRDEAGFVCVEVKDTGIGIERDELPRIFERFYRVDKARSRNSGGTGLGLAIVKHIVEAHKGKISVESTPGKGTSFFVKIRKKFPGKDKSTN
ncbi:two-component system histidine kinase PnpS [Peribacillus tepidiphilus]|uniref:two-component system histidine kinase PnpS n=1 Tax=Peribacillus tepidiphilus TaxID=2652445 RepID=UPI001291A704|nr:ATP-binding protein [Peribacillus tepidiphilus]